MINILKQKDVTKFYDILDINNGNILTKNKRLVVYKITPCRIINKSVEQEEQIYAAYVATMKMINFNYQIIIETKRIKFNSLLEMLEKNSYLSNYDIQRKVIEKYKEYLNKLSDEISVYDRSFFFITEQLDMEKERRLKEGFAFLESLGVRIERIIHNDKIFSLLYKTINKM